jgi:hypothetical protein
MKYLALIALLSFGLTACTSYDEEAEQGLKSPCVSAADYIKSEQSPCSNRRPVNQWQS